MIELVCYHTKSANLSLIIYIVHTRYIYIILNISGLYNTARRGFSSNAHLEGFPSTTATVNLLM